MVLPLDAAFQAERNEQTDRDGGQMDEDVTPAVGRLMGRMDVDHRLFLSGMRTVLLAQRIVLAASA